MDGIGKKKKRAVTLALGEAMFDAVGLLVRQYLAGGADAAEESFETERGAAAEAVNESFDESRFRSLQEGIESAAAADARRDASALLALPRGRAMEADETASRGARETVTFGASRETLREKELRAEDISARLERDARRYDGGFFA